MCDILTVKMSAVDGAMVKEHASQSGRDFSWIWRIGGGSRVGRREDCSDSGSRSARADAREQGAAIEIALKSR